MNIILSSLTTLPKLVDGKVCVINEDNTYNLYKPVRHVEIEDDFDSKNYAILVHDKYPRCVVYSTRREQEDFYINQLYREVKAKTLWEPTPYRVGDTIHIHSRMGMYKIVSIQQTSITITCNKWKNEAKPTHTIGKSDFKSLAGGHWNFAQ